jgi:preprotein translocase subunit SecG
LRSNPNENRDECACEDGLLMDRNSEELCKSCPENSNLNDNGDECECEEGLVLEDSQCRGRRSNNAQKALMWTLLGVFLAIVMIILIIAFLYKRKKKKKKKKEEEELSSQPPQINENSEESVEDGNKEDIIGQQKQTQELSCSEAQSETNEMNKLDSKIITNRNRYCIFIIFIS